MLRQGNVLQDRYEIVRILARGGMGRVYLGHHLGLGERRVAIKELVLELEEELQDSAIAEFEREATMLASLDHPSLVPATDFFQEDGVLYLVMGYVPGPTLSEVLDQAQRQLLPVDQVLDWADQICDVLDYLHRQTPPVLFRDLKPGNLLLDPEGRVRLIDFGISRFGCPGGRTATYLLGAGTPGYSPVEQYTGGTDPRSDIYALGATLYHLFTREIPPVSVALMSGEARLRSLRELQPEVSPGLAEVVLKMMALRAGDRYPTVAEARAALKSRALHPSSSSRREFRICALCNHLQVTDVAAAAVAFRCAVLGWETREEHIRETMQKHLTLSSSPAAGVECPHWEPVCV